MLTTDRESISRVDRSSSTTSIEALLGLAQWSRSIAARRCRSTGLVKKSAAPKGIAIPRLLGQMERRFATQRELAPYVNTATSLVVAGLLVLFGHAVMRPVVAASELPTRAAMPLAMGLVLVSLFVVVSRKKALTQVVGFLMLENGIALLALLGAYGVPLLVELGVFLDALMGFLVMQIFVYRIQETFETIDVDQLDRLRH